MVRETETFKSEPPLLQIKYVLVSLSDRKAMKASMGIIPENIMLESFHGKPAMFPSIDQLSYNNMLRRGRCDHKQ